MNAMTAETPAAPLDVLIVGAGISGIGLACTLERELPQTDHSGRRGARPQPHRGHRQGRVARPADPRHARKLRAARGRGSEGDVRGLKARGGHNVRLALRLVVVPFVGGAAICIT